MPCNPTSASWCFVRNQANRLALVAALLLGACGASTQREAFEKAETLEQQLPPEKAAPVLAEYQHVISLDPTSKWADRARERVSVLERKAAQAEELHKAVFQEHGVD